MLLEIFSVRVTSVGFIGFQHCNLLSHMNGKGISFNGPFIMWIPNNHGMMSAQFNCKITMRK